MRANILVVEDNPLNLKLLRLLLFHSGYEVWEARDAVQALAILEHSTPDLILMDIQLPGCDGLELTRQLRTREKLAKTPILAVTGYAMRSDQEDAMRAGCNDFIPKPFKNQLLLEVVARHLAYNGEP